MTAVSVSLRGSPKVVSPTDHSGATGFILYVEDNPELWRVTAGVLQTKGDRVRTASTGTEALSLVEKEPPELVMVDLHLPGEMGGLDLYRELQKRSTGKKLPFIITTGFAVGDS